ncbi:MAG TPA: terminase large subunit [Gemmatimonadales bacterium]|nr:terminase large subunit [Gemmatimonadales bacterium]
MTKRQNPAPERWPLGPGRPTLGPAVVAWIETNLVHAEGDYFGKPLRLAPWQQRIIHECYELLEDGSRRYDRVLVGIAKGNGKTELAAAISVAEFAGPVTFAGWNADGSPIGATRVSPDIPVAAASFEQADLVFGAARAMIRAGALAEFCEVFDTEILLKDGPGRLYRVAAVAGTNDGRRPTFFVADELHEWAGNKERVYLVLQNGRAKRRDGWQLAITTAGWDSTSLLGKLYAHGKRIQAGEAQDPRFLFVWFEADPKWDLSKADELEAALREANPAAGDFLPLENLVAQYGQIPDYEYRRYHLDQWTTSPVRWLPPEVWASRAAAVPVPDGSTIALGFDGSYSGDSTAVVGCTEAGHLFVVDCWEKPARGKDDWRVDVLDVEAAIRTACARWKVQAIGCDPYRWQRSMAVLLAEGLPIIEWPSHQATRMAPACVTFAEAVLGGTGLTHDGDTRLAQHIANCVVKTDSRGSRITKDHKDSVRHIDLAVAAVIAFDLAATRKVGAPRRSVYEDRGPLEVEIAR